jgi:hypothetical protein
LAGLDKFFNLLTNWEKYLPPVVVHLLPVSPATFMGIVGVIEMTAGLAVLTILTRLGSWIVMAWLVAIACTVVLAGYLDIAVRDLVMAVGAYALAQIAAMREKAYAPGSEATQSGMKTYA